MALTQHQIIDFAEQIVFLWGQDERPLLIGGWAEASHVARRAGIMLSMLHPLANGAERPFRAPHPTATWRDFTGTNQYAGEIELAHGGVLFLWDAPEFSSEVLRYLRDGVRGNDVRLIGSALPSHVDVLPDRLFTVRLYLDQPPSPWRKHPRVADPDAWLDKQRDKDDFEGLMDLPRTRRR